MKKKILIIPIIIAVVIIISACATVSYLYSNGLFKPAHNFTKAKDNQIKVACVGDSVTYGMKMKNWPKNAYPFVLRNMLGATYSVQNFGFSGRTVMLSADRPYMNEKLYNKSLQFNPDIVILQIGSNDSKSENWTNVQEFKRDYITLLESYMKLSSNPKIFICTPPPAFPYGDEILYDINAQIIENEICTAIKDVAGKYGIEIIDLQDIFANKAELFADGLHPNIDGGKLLAESVYSKISSIE